MRASFIRLQGGSWYLNRDYSRTIYRYYFYPHLRNYDYGFRVVCQGSCQIKLRGGSWINYGSDCRSASRNNIEPGYRNYFDGFRIMARKEEI